MALGTFLGEGSENREVTLKVDGVDAETLRQAVTPVVEKIEDFR